MLAFAALRTKFTILGRRGRSGRGHEPAGKTWPRSSPASNAGSPPQAMAAPCITGRSGPAARAVMLDTSRPSPGSGRMKSLIQGFLQPGAGRVDQVEIGALPVPHLTARVPGGGQDRRHRPQRPRRTRAVRVPPGVGGGRARDTGVVQGAGDPGGAVPVPSPCGVRLVRVRSRISEPVPVRRAAAQVPALLAVWVAIAVRTRILVRVISRLEARPSASISCSCSSPPAGRRSPASTTRPHNARTAAPSTRAGGGRLLSVALVNVPPLSDRADLGCGKLRVNQESERI